jgi:Asp-tRNA(Asn)/Glu-tRNA(Gln) amidotransferase A subunit family amidase
LGLLVLAAVDRSPRTIAAQSVPRAKIDVVERSILELQNDLRTGALTSRELVAEYLARVDAYDDKGPSLNAITHLAPRALEIADALDRERKSKEPRGPLHGIPVVVKDAFETVDMPTTAGTKALAGFETGRDAFQVWRLRQAGAIILGKTNMHEFGSGITSVSSAGGQTRNPYDPSRNPGGSSGGTAAAVAASFAAAGMAADTCGSIRVPAAHNNLFGLRVTHGLSSRYGIVPMAHSQDVAGPVARSVTDLAIMLDATVAPDPGDPLTLEVPGELRPHSYMPVLGDKSLGWVRIGVVTPLFGTEAEDGEVAAIVHKAIDALRSADAQVVPLDLRELQEKLRGASLINAEFKFDLLDYLAGFPHPPVRSLAELLALGLHHPAVNDSLRRYESVAERDSEQTRLIHKRRAAVREYVSETMAMENVDFFAYPTIRRVAAPVDERQAGNNCALSVVTGLPAISIPAGFTDTGLPVALELLAGAYREPALLSIAYVYEQMVHPRRAPSSTPPLPR